MLIKIYLSYGSAGRSPRMAVCQYCKLLYNKSTNIEVMGFGLKCAPLTLFCDYLIILVQTLSGACVGGHTRCYFCSRSFPKYSCTTGSTMFTWPKMADMSSREVSSPSVSGRC